MRRLVLAALLACAGAPAFAQQPAFSTLAAVTVTGSPTLVVPANTQFQSWLRVWNVSAAAVLWCSWSSATPAANASGSWLLNPGQMQTYSAPSARYVPALYCIAAGGTGAVTVDLQ